MRTQKGGLERYYTTDSPNNREIDQEFQYFGFDPYDSRCWCGNTPPFYPRAMQDCENGRRATSRIYSQTNSSTFIVHIHVCIVVHTVAYYFNFRTIV